MQVHEHELVEMTDGGLDYSIRNKLDTQYLRDMTQLTDRVWQVECLKVEKAKSNKFYKKENVAYIEAGGRDQGYDIGYEEVKENELNVEELNPKPPYVCKLLKPFDGKNPVKLKKWQICHQNIHLWRN